MAGALAIAKTAQDDIDSQQVGAGFSKALRPEIG